MTFAKWILLLISIVAAAGAAAQQYPSRTIRLGLALIEHVASEAAPLASGSVVVDLGCGTGEAMGTMVDRHGVCGVGIDLSVRAIERAARRWPSATWVVANADRRLPLLDRSASLVTGWKPELRRARTNRFGGRIN